ncbi:SDR family NAD(P)-dependent oxidoreductase [Pseudaquabacterium rugosum]|uniref:SDR family NAD(P)-dependent oxidoreductase n=1 Tax=Pseudaquabacterium rugosum TaxID=2984194 RepID=A0ABU9BF06_9BURK
MQLDSTPALVTGGGSGLGEATARALAAAGARVAVLDINAEAARRVADDIGPAALALACDITDEAAVATALDRAESAHGTARLLFNVAGIGGAKRVIQRDGSPAPLADFDRTLRVNLSGSYNISRLFAARCAKLEPAGELQERGLVLLTASVAAFDGQIGQAAYAASKGGIAAMTLPLARDLAQWGIRVMTIAPGLFATPLLQELPAEVQQSLAAAIPFPKRLGRPEDYAALALHIAQNPQLNGEVIRLDGALRMAAR